MIRLFNLALLCLMMGNLFSQGTLRGTIIDDSNVETVPFANILVNETGTGTTSDLDGAYSLNLEAGTYSIDFSFLGYSTTTVTEVVISDGEVTLLDIRMKEESSVLEEVVVTAKQIRNTESAILTIQKRSPNLLDGISSQTFKKIGDSDAGSAIRRVTGVSVEGGKYVFVRGLGDRYTKSILNGMDVPGLDPDRNTLQMDIFPTNLIDNIIVVKSFTPDLPGDFTGGVVDIVTKDFPEEKTMSVSASAGLNPNMNLKDNYLSSAKSSTDFLGFDNGLRQLPLATSQVIPAPAQKQALLTDLTRTFNPQMAAQQQTSGLNYGLGFSLGNQINKDKVTFGYNAALNYRNNTEFYEDAQYGFYRKPDLAGAEIYQLEKVRSQSGNYGTNDILLSGLLGGAIKYKNHKLTLNLIRIQNGTSSAGQFEQISILSNSNTLFKDNIEYGEKSVTNALLAGKHSFTENGWDIEWGVSPTISTINDKDVRVTPFRFDDGEYAIEPSEGAEPRRIWRNLEETNLGGRIDITKQLSIGGRDSKLKFGYSHTIKNRDYSILTYRINVRGQAFLGINGNPDAILSPENVWTTATDRGSYIIGNFEPANTFDATQTIVSGYVMNELSLSDQLKVIYGARVEKFDHRYTGQTNLGDVVYNDQKIIDNFNILPAANFIYSVNEDMNIRASFSRTLARPSFKEASIAQIYDALSDRTFIGNINLKSTDVNNFDVRLENYSTGGQMAAVSGFYKSFLNPIEVVAFSEATPNQFQPRNVGNAKVYGVELEIRKNLSFLSQGLSPLSIGTNVTVVQSEVEMTDAEFSSRQGTARPGETVKSTRQMQGQSPFIINGILSYNGLENGLEANVSYNVQGKRLAIVGIGAVPDVYEQPFHALNAKISKNFGPDSRMSLSLTANNILSSRRLKEYESYQAASQVFELLRPMRSFSLGFGYKFF